MTTSLPVPERVDDMSPAWLTAALTATGVLRSGRVAAVRWERVGQAFGFTGVVARGEVRYESASGSRPDSLVAKLPMARDDSVSGYRAAQDADASAARRYFDRCAREAHFYRLARPECAPELYHAAVDESRRRVVLLLEDVSGGLQGDLLRGCSIADVRLVIDALVPLHARWWETARPDGFERIGPDPRTWQARYALQADRFLDSYEERIEQQFAKVVVELRPRLAAIAEAFYARPRTLVHGDLHLDNLIFDRRRADRPVVVLDWQTAAVGPPAWDVALLVFDSLTVEERRTAEVELFDRYVTQLWEHGVRGYTAEQLRHDCGLALVLWLAGTVSWLATVDRSALTEREEDLRRAIFTEGRLPAALLDHGVADLLGEVVPAM